MARREITVTISAEGRDKGKVFTITEMAARPAHAWATEVIFAVMNAGVDVDGIQDGGVAALAAVGLKALGQVPYAVAQPLLDRLLDCVQFVPAPSKPDVRRSLYDDDIEEAATFFRLQKEVVMLHIGPFIGGASSTTA